MDPEAEALLDPLALAGRLRQSRSEVPHGQHWMMDAFAYVSGRGRVKVKRERRPPLWAAWAREHRATWRFNSHVEYGDPLHRLVTRHPEELTRWHVLELMLCTDERRDKLLEIAATRRPELFLPGPTLPLAQRSPVWCLHELDRLSDRCAVKGNPIPQQAHPVLGALLLRAHGTSVPDVCAAIQELASRSQVSWPMGNIQLRRLLLPFPAHVRTAVAQEFTQRFTGRIPMIAVARTPQMEAQLDRCAVPPNLAGRWRGWRGVTAQQFPATMLVNVGGESLGFRRFVDGRPLDGDFPFELRTQLQYTEVGTGGLKAFCLNRTGSELGLEIHLPIDRWAELVNAQPALFGLSGWFVTVNSDRVADFHRALVARGARFRILAPQHSVDLWMLDAAERGAIDLHILSPRVSGLDETTQAQRWAAECEQSLLRSQS